MHIAKTSTIWHSYTKCKAGKCYGIITKRVDCVVSNLHLSGVIKTLEELEQESTDGFHNPE